MALEISSSTGHLAPGRHLATMAELEQVFVRDAPFEKQRAAIFAAFTIWVDQILDVVPSIRTLWVNGGFVTHKGWAPADIDVVALKPVIVKHPTDTVRLHTLLTHLGPPKVQPMAGLVDGFLATVAPTDSDYWDRKWTAVVDQAKHLVPGAEKGYVEVKVNG